MLFDNIPALKDANASTEKETPEASPAEKKTTTENQPVSKDAKTSETKVDETKSEETRLDKHSRFQELLAERRAAKAEADEWKAKYDELSASQKTVATAEAAKITGVAPASIPKFDTVEELVSWVMTQKDAAKQEALTEFEAKQSAKTNEEREVDESIASELDDLAVKDETLLTKEGRNAFLEFALDNELTNLSTAYKLYSQINATKEAGMQKGEEIGKRKAASGLKSTVNGSQEQKTTFRRGQSLDDVFTELKRNIPQT